MQNEPTPASRTASTIAPVFGNVLEMVGNTPMLELRQLDTGPCQLFVKLESLNPSNSIKDRIAVSMVNAAEKSGDLKPGGHIIEATAGNTGLSLALVAGQRGYRVTVVVPDKMSDEKISHLRAMGATIVLTRSDVARGHSDYYQDVAEKLADADPDAFFINQFFNDSNTEAHYTTTGPEIWQQLDGRVDAFVAGVGSGGTIAGVARYLKEQDPNIQIVLADPTGSILAPKINDGVDVEPGSWLVEGIGEDFIPGILDMSLIDSAYAIDDSEAFAVARELLKIEGILAGSSVGTLLGAALRYCREQTEPKRVVSLICDNGAKYLSKMFNDHWMIDQGFIERECLGDLRDLISRRHLDGEDFTLQQHEPMLQAIRRMRMYGISQMIVMDKNNAVQGILDESDLLLALTRKNALGTDPVSDFMTRKVETISPDASIDDLLDIFARDRVAIVMDDRSYYGLITRIDLINYLRKQLP